MRKLALRLDTVLADGRDEHFDDKMAITFDARLPGHAFGNRKPQAIAGSFYEVRVAPGRIRSAMNIAIAATNTGTATIRNSVGHGICTAINAPPITGATIEAERPIPIAQPTPAPRTAGGNSPAASAGIASCAPNTPIPARNTSGRTP